MGAIQHLGQAGHRLDRVTGRDVVGAVLGHALLELEPEMVDGRLHGVDRLGFEVPFLVFLERQPNGLRTPRAAGRRASSRRARGHSASEVIGSRQTVMHSLATSKGMSGISRAGAGS